MRPREPLLKRLPGHLGVKSLDQLDPKACWPWHGALGRGQSPVVKLDGRNVTARRAIYDALVRPLAPEELLRRRCDHPVCVNPDHMQVSGEYLAPFETGAGPEPEPPDDEGLTLDDLIATLLELPDRRDPDELATLLAIPAEMIREALLQL